MSFLTEEEKAALIARINHAESRTRGEIVTVIAQQSDGYRYIPMLWAALIALSIPGLYYLFYTINAGDWIVETHRLDSAAQWLYAIQVLVFFGVAMVFQIPAVRMMFVPQSVKHRRAARHAREQFFLQNLHQTEGRTGVLIFVSVAEHYVEIIVDSAVAEVVDNGLWESTVDDFIANVRRGKIAAGFENAIEQCRDVLWEHFPATDDCKSDELPNHLIEV
ncbi:MAG: TPM domain-containing protein [Granulosicoccus sp.]|nr:TPM domain-containing protein [Granulosicoccus sp.]